MVNSDTKATYIVTWRAFSRYFRFFVLIALSGLALVLFFFAIAGPIGTWGYQTSLQFTVNEHTSLHLYSENGAFGFSVIKGGLEVISALGEGRAPVPCFAQRPGFLLFGYAPYKKWDWQYWEKLNASNEDIDMHRVPIIEVKVTRSDLYVPAWLVVLGFAVYPIYSLVLIPFRRFSRREAGLCVICAYDLRGCTTEICPECGTEVAAGSKGCLKEEKKV